MFCPLGESDMNQESMEPACPLITTRADKHLGGRVATRDFSRSPRARGMVAAAIVQVIVLRDSD